jgi:hypothetical protein
VLVSTVKPARRRLLLDRIGYERFLDITDAALIQHDDYGKLWQTTLPSTANHSASSTSPTRRPNQTAATAVTSSVSRPPSQRLARPEERAVVAEARLDPMCRDVVDDQTPKVRAPWKPLRCSFGSQASRCGS